MRHRTSSIAGTKEGIPGYPATLHIYKIPASKFYWVKAALNGKRIKRSLKTESRSAAITAAKDFYNELLLKKAQGKPLLDRSDFIKAAEGLLAVDKTRVARGERKESMVRDIEAILDKDLLPFFRKDHLKNINFQRITEYVDRLQERKLSTATIKNHFIILRKILKHAWKMELLDKLPIFPTLSSKAHPREWFTEAQYERLRKTITELKGTVVPKTYTPITDELRLLITFLVNTFLRPQDIKNLKNKHVTIMNNKYLRITTPDSKTVKSPVVSMRAAVFIFRDLMRLNGTTAKSDEYLFLPKLKNRGYAFQTMRLQFNHALEKAGLKYGEDGTPRTLYSLRHTAIMFRLTKGENVDLLTLARNCRTSVDMIEKFYASHLKPEMNIEQLQRMKK